MLYPSRLRLGLLKVLQASFLILFFLLLDILFLLKVRAGEVDVTVVKQLLAGTVVKQLLGGRLLRRKIAVAGEPGSCERGSSGRASLPRAPGSSLV